MVATDFDPNKSSDQLLNEPPPPYPGLDAPTGPPPAYPGPPVSGDPQTFQPPLLLPGGIQVCVPNPGTAAYAAGGNGGDCPNCGAANLVSTPDLALILCLFLVAFLFTPFVLCCIPCAFKRQCPNCHYSAP